MSDFGRIPNIAAVVTHPNGHLWRTNLSTAGACALGDPEFGGVCPGYRRVGWAMRVPGGWWRIKGQETKP